MKPFHSLLEPFSQLNPEKQEVLREVLQIYVSKDSAKRTELEKRKQLSAVLNDFVKASSEEEA